MTLVRHGCAGKFRSEMAPYFIRLFVPRHLRIRPKLDEKAGEFINLDPEQPTKLGLRRPPSVLMEPRTISDGGTKWVLDHARRVLGARQKIFISYPSAGQEYMEELRQRLESDKEKRWEIEVYIDTTPADFTYSEARRLISDSDYFIGIWHPENKDGAVLTSPWLPFELGLAMAFHKPFKLVAHSSLPRKELVQRIAGDTAAYWYKDMDEFKNIALKSLLAFMESNWCAINPPLFPHIDEKSVWGG